MRQLFTGLSLCLALVGCVTPAAKAPPTDVAIAANPFRLRSAEILIKGPGALGSGGKIVSDAGASQLRAPAFRLSAASEGFAPVVQADVRLETLEGDRVGRAELRTDDKGVIALNNVIDAKVIVVVASFKAKDKTYEVATLIPNGEIPGPLVADPITAMIDARVTQVAKAQPFLTSLTFEKLARIHAICDQAGVEVGEGALVAGQPISVLNGVWEREMAAKVTNAGEKAEVEALIAAIQAEVGGGK